MKVKVLALAVACWVGACNGRATAESPAVAPAECPASSFNEFLEAFASNAKVREAYTRPTVSVVDYHDPNSLDDQRLVTMEVPRAEYRGFTLFHDARGFHNVDAIGEIDPAPVDVQIQQRGADYYVRYIYGMSEGNSWLFASEDGCWHLAQDPEPPTE